MQDEFVNWIVNDHVLVAEKMNNNNERWQELFNELQTTKAILNPKLALALSQTQLEYEQTRNQLKENYAAINLPKAAMQKLTNALNDGLDLLSEIMQVDFDNGGNYAIIYESMNNDESIDADMLNITENMI